MADQGGGGASPLVVAIVAVLSAAIAGAASFGVGYLTFASKDQELKVHLVEIAIGILRADPKEDVNPARGWALDIIAKNSGMPFSQKDREALLHKPLPAETGASLDQLTQMLMMMTTNLGKLQSGSDTPHGKQAPTDGK
jgi:hypothetical protein